METMGFIQSQTTENQESSPIIVKETFTHSIAFGETGCGKTTGYIYPNLKERLESGHGILLYDYKGKEHLSVKYLAEESHRLDDVIEIGKPWGKNINIIQNMDEDELDKFFEILFDHGKDGKFWQNGSKSLAQSILKILKGIEVFSRDMQLCDAKWNRSKPYISAGDFKYPQKRNMTSLVQICKTFEYLGSFISNLDSLKSETQSIISNSIIKNISADSDIKLLKDKYNSVIKSRLKLLEIIDATSDSLASFGDESNENLSQNIIGSMTAPLLTLSQNKYFNDDAFDIVKALNEGKIVVINTESLSETIVESLNNSLMYELSKRTRKIHLNPISIFIDEVQRMMSSKTDFPIDVFREAKVELFLATQNSALLKDKLEEEKFEALMGNLTRKYYFQNSAEEDLESVHNLNDLESFEYIHSLDSYARVASATPLYMTNEQKIMIEYKYQKKLKVLENHLYPRKQSALVLEYIPRLFNEGKVIAIDVHSMEEDVVESVSKANIMQLDYEVKKLFKRLQLENSLDEEEDDSFEALEFNEYERSFI